MPAVIEAIHARAAEPTPLSPGEFLALMQADSARYGRFIRERKITAD